MSADKEEKEDVSMALIVRRMREQLPATLEFERLRAKLVRERFLALKLAGFTDAEALELCKGKLSV